MNMRNHDMTRIGSVGFLTFLIFSVLLFGARKLVEIFLWEMIPNNPELVVRSPILEPGLDPNLEIVRHACIIAQMNKDKVYKTSFAFIDIEHYFRRFKVYNNPDGDLCLRSDSRLWYDTSKGLYYVYEWLPDEEEKPVQKEPVITYFGPKGAGEKPSRTLGRFHDPMASVMWAGRSIIVYDRHQPYFYRVDIKDHKVTKGPKLVNEARYIQLSCMEKTPKALQLSRIPPYTKVEVTLDQQDNQTSLQTDEQKLKSVPIPLYCQSVYAGDFIPVLNENGRIEKLDVETLEITGDLGSMVTGTEDSLTQSVRPRDLLAYEVQFLVYKREYKGLAVACLDRNIKNAAVALFDDRGARIKSEVNQNQMRPGSERVDFSVIPISYQLSQSPFAVLYAVSRFLVETLNPLAVNMITCYTAGEFEAVSSRRALFFLSDTIIGKIISESGEQLIKTAEILFLSLPAGLLGLFLAWRVSKNARQVGLSRNRQSFWIIMVIFFGIPAYITYRLTRPEMVLVSCRNCGQMRRPDQELCHQCKSPWLVPELAPPAWRVREG